MNKHRDDGPSLIGSNFPPSIDALQLRTRSFDCTLFPSLGFCIAVFTIVSTYALARYYQHVPLVPYISLNGIFPPETYVYAWGFVLVSVCLSAGAFVLFDIMERQLSAVKGIAYYERHYNLWNRAAFVTQVLAAFFLGVHGVVPLQDDAMKALEGQVVVMKTQSIVHAMSASLFFLCSMVHALCGVRLMAVLRSAPAYRFSFRVKVVCFALIVVFFTLSLFLSPGAQGNVGARQRLLVGGAILQYALVLSILIFATSYVYELRGNRVAITPAISVPRSPVQAL